MRELKKWTPQKRVNMNRAISTRSSGIDLMFLLKNVLFLIIKGISFNSNEYFLFSMVHKLQVSNDSEWLKNRWFLTQPPSSPH